MLTPWFLPNVQPVRDGVYLTRSVYFHGLPPSECWHAMRWSGRTQMWYSAATVGNEESDAIGGGGPNAHHYQWRGLAASVGRGQ